MNLETLEYDLRNVKAGDYTIKMDISDSQYDYFVKNYQKEINEKFEGSIASAFKYHLKNEIQTYLKHHSSGNKNDDHHTDAKPLQTS